MVKNCCVFCKSVSPRPGKLPSHPNYTEPMHCRLIMFFTYACLFLPGFLGNLICVLHGVDFCYNAFTEFLFFSAIFLRGDMIAVVGDFPSSLCSVLYFPKAVSHSGSAGDLCCSADFLPCMCCASSFFQLSLQILLSPGHRFHLF